MKIKSSLPLLLLFALSIFSCSKPQEISWNDQHEANFTYSIIGDTVFFTNTSVGITSYSWDFGDGGSSVEVNPVHVFPGKGSYLVTLAAADGSTSTAAHTPILIDKYSPVKLDDGSFDDWNTVTKYSLISSAAGGAARSAKVDYDANYVYFYVQEATTLADNTIFTAFFNTDNDNTTGFYNGSFPDLGADFYFEGQLLQPDGARWYDPYEFTGGDDHAGWNWGYVDKGEFLKMGTYLEDNDVVTYEFGLDRNKVPGFKSENFTFAFQLLDSTWSDYGFIPDAGDPGWNIDLTE
jgi:PKD repeat protein